MSARGLVSRLFKENNNKIQNQKLNRRKAKNSVKIGISNKTEFSQTEPQMIEKHLKIKISQQP